MKGKTIFITGSSDGIGKQTAWDLAKKGAKVILHGKDEAKTKAVFEEIQKDTNNQYLDYIVADFSSLKQIKKMGNSLQKKYEKIDILVNNAGVLKKERIITEDNLDYNFVVNYLSSFMNTVLLFDLVKNSEYKQIINITSVAHANFVDFDNLQGENNYDFYVRYSVVKLLNIICAYHIVNQIPKNQVYVNALHPGIIKTKLTESIWNTKNSPQLASINIQSLIELQRKHLFTGKYFVSLRKTISARISYKKEIQKKLWELSENLSKLNFKF